MTGDPDWIDPAHPAPDVTVLGHFVDPVTPDYHVWLLRRGERLLFRTRRDSTRSEGQRSVPLAAAAWLQDSIQNGFWREPAAGGLPMGTTTVKATIAGEPLELRRGWGLGGPDERGFTLTNYARMSVLDMPEELALTDELLLSGLLERLGTA